MSDIDKVMQDIEAGKGLEPFDPNSIQSIPDGVTSEQRGDIPGISVEIFTLNNEKKGKE